MNEETITWNAPEYPYRQKSTDWYWALGIMALAGAVASYIVGNFLFAVLILLGAFTVAVYGARHPHTIEFEISRRGVRLGTVLYPYSSLSSFWIIESNEESKILLESNKFFVPIITIPLGNTNPEVVHMFLINFLEERERKESFAQKIMDYLRF